MDPQASYEAYKDKIGERLTRKLISALEEKKITPEEVSEVSQYILANIDKARTNLELLDFTEHLASKWAIFSEIVNVEEAEIKENSKTEKVNEVQDLIEQNKIDEALKVATDANDQIHGGAN
jgi:hypothetical protein